MSKPLTQISNSRGWYHDAAEYGCATGKRFIFLNSRTGKHFAAADRTHDRRDPKISFEGTAW